MPSVERTTVSLSSVGDIRYGGPASCNTRSTESTKRSPYGLRHEGDPVGPFVAGSDGVVLFEVMMMGDPRSFPADPAGGEAVRAERGIEQLPSPPIGMADRLEDSRS
jgi:hypothetical protein